MVFQTEPEVNVQKISEKSHLIFEPLITLRKLPTKVSCDVYY